jgi:transposase
VNEAALLQENKELKEKIARKDIQIIKLEEQVRLLEHLHFGAKTEKLTREDRLTASLFNEAEDAAFRQDDPVQIEAARKTIELGPQTRTVKKKAGRKPFSESLPREERVYDLAEEDKICACRHELKCIGEDVSERLKIIPPQVTVIREIRKKYVCEHCEGLEREDEKGVVTAQGPKHLIPGSMADESFLAWSISEKFEFALPFYRQAIRLKQIGAPIPRATLSNLTVTAGNKCEPIYKLLRPHLLSGPAINGDETRVQVLKEPGRKNESLSWMWVFLGGPPGEECVRYQYEETRSHETPYAFLKGYEGLFQSDDYEGYHTAIRRLKNETGCDIQHFLCWAHVRRYFYRYWESTKKQDREAKAILELIRDVFELENLREHYSRERFLRERKHKAEQIFTALKKKLDILFPQTPSGLSFGKAIAYTLDNWEQLISYVDHFELTPSNNIAERAIRPFVIGRKNWLFSGSPAGATSSAILYSLIESAKLHGLKPFEYLYYIFRQLPYCQNEDAYRALLPFNVKPEQLQAVR